MLKILKISAGSVVAILLANILGLNYSASAGIITLLTIQDTTKETIAISFGESNNAKALLEDLSELLSQMKESSLPVTREEFEERAILFSVLMDLNRFLQLKKNFADNLTAEQIRRYWHAE